MKKIIALALVLGMFAGGVALAGSEETFSSSVSAQMASIHLTNTPVTWGNLAPGDSEESGNISNSPLIHNDSSFYGASISVKGSDWSNGSTTLSLVESSSAEDEYLLEAFVNTNSYAYLNKTTYTDMNHVIPADGQDSLNLRLTFAPNGLTQAGDYSGLTYVLSTVN